MKLAESTCSSPSPLLSVADYSPLSVRSEFKTYVDNDNNEKITKSLTTSPFKIDSKLPLLRCFELPKLSLGDRRSIRDKRAMSFVEENLSKIILKRRCSTPSVTNNNSSQKRISEFRESGVKTDSENDEALQTEVMKRRKILESEVLFSSPENFLITKTAPSVERFEEPIDVSTSSDDGAYR